MAPPVFAFYVACLLLPTRAWGGTSAQNLSSTSRFLSVKAGGDVTLDCSFKDSLAVMFYWYKQILGEKPQIMSKFYKHEKNGTLLDEFEHDPRIFLDVSMGKNNLKISHVQSLDSATYYCVGGYSYVFEFLESFIVSVEHSGSSIQAFIHQSAAETVRQGGSVTLNCTVQLGTCDGEQSVYWFQDSGESHQGIIYTPGAKNDQCQRKTETPIQTCVYNLHITNLDHSNVGTYYCAAASCGRVLFGNGTELKFEDGGDSLMLVYFLTGALVFTTVLSVFLAHKALNMFMANSCQCTDIQERSSPSSAPISENNKNEDNLHYAALKGHKISRSRQRDDTMSDCVYSLVRQ